MKSSNTAGGGINAGVGIAAGTTSAAYSGAIYGILALFIPLSVLCALVLLLAAAMPAGLDPAFPSVRIIVLGCLSGLAAALYHDLLTNMKTSHAMANIRGCIAVMLFAYLAASLCAFSLPLRSRFLPGIANLLSPLAGLYAWCLVILLKQLFRGRRRFEEYTETYRGEQLQRAIADDADLINSSVEKNALLRKTYIIELFIIGILALICSVFTHLSVPLAVLLLVVVITAVCMFAYLAMMKQEHFFAAEGMAVSANLRFKRIIGILVFSAAAIVLALLLASNTSILPLSLLSGFFAWLLSLFDKPVPPLASAETEDMTQVMPGIMDFGFEGMEEATPWIGWKYIQYGLAVLAILAFLWFMVKPLLDRSLFRSRFGLKVRRLFAEWLSGLKKAFAAFLAMLKSDKGVKVKQRVATDHKKMSKEIFAAYSPAKKKKIQENVSLFARLIIWGREECGVEWKPSFAPFEYCGILARAIQAAASGTTAAHPKAAAGNTAALTGATASGSGASGEAAAGNVLRCGRLFEQALYSPVELTRTEQDEFRTLVETTVKETQESG